MSVAESPLVTCVCLTRNRRQFLPRAINCFLAQEYPAKELLILADGEDVSGLVPADDRSIQLVRVADGMSISAKRNLGCEFASGPVIAHWDDDDWSAPGRLAEQVGYLDSCGVDVVAYRKMRFTDGRQSWRYRHEDYAHGTSLLYRRSWWLSHAFSERMVFGEDNAFAWAARNAGRLALLDAREMMFATIHEGNTCIRSKMHPNDWEALA